MTEQEFIETFSGNFCEIVFESGYSQRDIARLSGISQSTLSKYMRGRLMPSLRNVVNLSYILNCDVRDLCDFGDMIV